MSERFVIEGLAGKKTLQGEVEIKGAKNAALKALPASVLFEDEMPMGNLPDIEDVRRMQELIAGLKDGPVLRKDIAERLRASIVLTGPVLARDGEVTFPYPGGCVLGERPIDLFLQGFKALGAEVEEKDDLFHFRAKNKKLKGARIFFPFISVTATETLMLAAVLAEGETVLQNAAMEPEIPVLAEYLNACGANITGAGTPTITITGGGLLHAAGRKYVTPPDRIEAGSFIILAALAGKEVKISHCEPKHMGALLAVLRRADVDFEIGKDYVTVFGGNKENSAYKLISVRTHEYPGFPTDLQAPMAVFMSQATGEGTLLETIFDGRFRYADDLIRMGADITVMNPHKILVRGPKNLSRKELEGPDLRAGLAYILAATVAEGTSTINNPYVIDRGYERIEERLFALGLSIRREQV
ncbi:UDP-N-acetylglucosamine 1-carboxyvinyltransferase [Acetobacteraceae bacterium]|nr:UDP-N-acetylglucosamine 1-carboxyvinyltransferase [Candidatus Parcubacteria bacterium]